MQGKMHNLDIDSYQDRKALQLASIVQLVPM